MQKEEKYLYIYRMHNKKSQQNVKEPKEKEHKIESSASVPTDKTDKTLKKLNIIPKENVKIELVEQIKNHLHKKSEDVAVVSDTISKAENNIKTELEYNSKEKKEIETTNNYIWKVRNEIQIPAESNAKEKLDIKESKEQVLKNSESVNVPKDTINKNNININLNGNVSKSHKTISQPNAVSKSETDLNIKSDNINKEKKTLNLSKESEQKNLKPIKNVANDLNKDNVILERPGELASKDIKDIPQPPHTSKEDEYLAETHWQHKFEENVSVPFEHEQKIEKTKKIESKLEKEEQDLEELVNFQHKDNIDIEDKVSDLNKIEEQIEENSLKSNKQDILLNESGEHFTKQLKQYQNLNTLLKKSEADVSLEEIIQNIKSDIANQKIIDIEKFSEDKISEIFGEIPHDSSNRMMNVTIKQEMSDLIQNIASEITQENLKRSLQEPWDRNKATNIINRGDDIKTENVVTFNNIESQKEDKNIPYVTVNKNPDILLNDDKNLNIYDGGIKKLAPEKVDFENASLGGSIYQDENQYNSLIESEKQKIVNNNKLVQHEISRAKNSYQKIEKSDILTSTSQKIDVDSVFALEKIKERRKYDGIKRNDIFESIDKKAKNYGLSDVSLDGTPINNTKDSNGSLITYIKQPTYDKKIPYKASKATYDDNGLPVYTTEKLYSQEGGYDSYIEETENIKQTKVEEDGNIVRNLNSTPISREDNPIVYDKVPIEKKDSKGIVTFSTGDYTNNIDKIETIKDNLGILTANPEVGAPKRSYQIYEKKPLYAQEDEKNNIYMSTKPNNKSTSDYNKYIELHQTLLNDQHQITESSINQDSTVYKESYSGVTKNIPYKAKNHSTDKTEAVVENGNYNNKLNINSAISRRSNYQPITYGIEKNKIINKAFSFMHVTPKKEAIGLTAPGVSAQIGLPHLATNIIGNYYSYFFEKNIQNRSSLTPTPKTPNELIASKVGLIGTGGTKVIPKTASEGKFDTPHNTKIDMSKVRPIVLKSPATGKPLRGYGYLEIFPTGNSSVNISGSSDKDIYKTENKKDSPSIPAKIPFQFTPEIASDSRSANYSNINILGRSSSLYAFTGTANRQLTLTLNYLAVFANERNYTANEERFLSNPIIKQSLYNKEGTKKSYISDALKYAKAHENTQGMEDLEGWDEDSVYWVVSALRALILPQYKDNTTPPPVVRLHYGEYYKKKLTYKDRNSNTHVEEIAPLFIVTARDVSFSGMINPETKRHQAVKVTLTLVEIDEDVYTYQTFYDTAAFRPKGAFTITKQPFNIFKFASKKAIGTLIKNVGIKI